LELRINSFAGLYEWDFKFAADGVSHTDGHIQWQFDIAGWIRESGEFELLGWSASDLHNATCFDYTDCNLYLDGGRERGQLQLQRACGWNGRQQHYSRCASDAECGGL
jgi:hypothetical protein